MFFLLSLDFISLSNSFKYSKLSKFDANVVKFSKREVKLHDIIYSAYDKVNALSDLKNVNIMLQLGRK